jgi:soluble lytic murein transglycosylase
MKLLIRLLAASLALVVAGCSAPGLAAGDSGSDRVEAGSVRAERSLVRDVVAAAERRDWAAAEAAARRTGEPLLATWVTWRRLREGDAADFATYRAFLDANPDWPEAARIQARAEELLDESVPAAEVSRFFAERPPRTRLGRLRHAEALLAAGRLDEGRAALRRSWIGDDHPLGDEQAILERYGRLLTRRDHEERLERLLWDGSAGAARRMLPLVGARERAIAEARLALQAGGKTADRALRHLSAELAADPGVLFDRIRLERKRGRHGTARALLLSVRREPHRPDAWWGERGHYVRAALDAGDAATAYRLAAGHRLSEGPAMAEAEWLAGWLALRRLGRPVEALGHFERLFERAQGPLTKSRAAYWAGRAAAAVGRTEASRAWFERASRWPTTWYGQLAAAELGRRPQLGADPPTIEPARRDAFARLELVRLADLFCGAGLPAEAGPPIRRLAERAEGDPGELTLTLELAVRCGRLDLATALGRAPVREGRVDPLLAFPVPRLDGFLRPDGGAEPALLLAVARQESQFDPGAVSPAGARGLMQLMPATARAVARELEIAFRPHALLAEPAYNLRLGARYLGRQLDNFGEPALALAAYNAGPGRVEAWLARYGDPRGRGRHALVDWIESIPFRETRNYVQRVLEGAEVYRWLLAERRAPALPFAPPLSSAGLEPQGEDRG